MNETMITLVVVISLTATVVAMVALLFVLMPTIDVLSYKLRDWVERKLKK